MNSTLLQPGNTIGIIGNYFSSTQLINAARDAGLRIATYSTHDNSQIQRQADIAFVGKLDDKEQLQRFAEQCDVVTYVSDLMDPEILAFIQKFAQVPQGMSLLEMVQDRAIEHAFFEQLNVNSAPYATVVNLGDVYQAIEAIGYPATLKPILKNSKNCQQFEIKTKADIQLIGSLFDHGAYILESGVPYQQRFSVIAAKDVNNQIKQFPPVITEFVNHQPQTINTVLDKVDDEVVDEMIRITDVIGNNIKYVGAYEVSFGITKDGALYVCGITPTVSKTGYLFNLAININEYRQHLRAISGIPLADVTKYSDVIMQTFTKRQVPAIIQERLKQPDWHFIFDYQSDAIDDDYSGCLLIPTKSVTKSLEKLAATKIWENN
ncbi:ATP-grasp domain-containing protein [Fructilactobacillus lindneri]|uniref:ATP-grasp domain-containing protein n=1 Tax=Fructilactobacillus lindneri TaxID=53444 RepID=A0AB33BRU5_9LACO|nr:ATP-grasp domain-containing protein [Fructilactobacillus lindneri]ANZ57958.1 hypothetical protein AYR60_03925 [Fructilactobacillus lindneri]ANZ59228.1 hypothetical protein AYR59_03925 [Fructilactobacillus lindneri]POG98279.1 hypothetical protein BGL31_04250 [Fructilactobacillus lindneri]POH01604.1 hypothetical protein BGL32_03175 [Fructilactobacillus lindneri]POH03447.1 hypothetical protein BGL33_02060 [Fructilactobacillus lindneri]